MARDVTTMHASQSHHMANQRSGTTTAQPRRMIPIVMPDSDMAILSMYGVKD